MAYGDTRGHSWTRADAAFAVCRQSAQDRANRALYDF
jgi:hypothetical protein